MFGNQDELFKPSQNNMVINIIGSNYLHEGVTSTCLDITEGEYVGKLRIISLLNTDGLFQKKLQNKGESGILNLEWIRITTHVRPATIILVYDLKNKVENITWKDYENAIYSEIIKIKKIDQIQNTNIVVLIYHNQSSFNFDNFSDDKDRSYSIRKILDPKNLYYVNQDGLKGISKKLGQHILKITIAYYKNLKKILKSKRNYAYEIKDREKMIKYNIKLGVVSQMKNKKRNWKYFEEAYSILANLDFKNSNNPKLAYYELKAVADWLYFKIFYTKLYDPNNITSIVSGFNSHISNFSKADFLNDEIAALIEYNWRSFRFELFAKYLEDNGKFEFYNKNPFNFHGYHFMLAAFNISRLVNMLSNQDFLKEIQSYKEIKTESYKIRENKYYGKPPKFYLMIDPLNEKEVPFDEGICIKNYLSNNNFSKEHLFLKLNESLSKAERAYKKLYPKDKEPNVLSLNINILTMLSIDPTNLEKLQYLYKPILSFQNLTKFPDLYVKLFTEYNNILMSDTSKDRHQVILGNLMRISSVRCLNVVEEEYLD
jgi:hypothetical protein